MNTKLQYDLHEMGDASQKAIVAIHGWQGDRISMFPLIKSMNIINAGWYMLEAPFPVKNGKGFSWSYEKQNGEWEIDEPWQLLNDFFGELFKKYDSKKIYVMGFSQGGLVCLDFVLFLNEPLAGVFPIAGFLRQPEYNGARFHKTQKNTPILIGHGTEDDRVPVETSKNAYKQLVDQGANAELLLYKGKHKIGVEFIRKMKEKIQSS
ncbi:MAG: prolyl oligopeptidase family serine peptidase [Candidatus Marinimicrobia bacterium]|nr:prolyl oligopeptidase family serine peptidase [Candidatus Neomarinimicrobiota bacterium]